MSEPIALAAEATENDPQSPPCEEDRSRPALVEQDLLVEDVSIDGMCGVY